MNEIRSSPHSYVLSVTEGYHDDPRSRRLTGYDLEEHSMAPHGGELWVTPKARSEDSLSDLARKCLDLTGKGLPPNLHEMVENLPSMRAEEGIIRRPLNEGEFITFITRYKELQEQKNSKKR